MKTWEEMTKDGYVIQGKQKNVAVKQMNPTSDNLGELIKSILTNSYVDSTPRKREGVNMQTRVYCLYRVSTVKQVDFNDAKTVYLASGEKKGVKRIRYICYNKSRKNCECEGQTGYTSHILDELVDSVVRELLDQLGFVDEKRLLSDIHLRSERQLNEKIWLASQRLREAEEEYELLKPEILKALKGAGEFPVELLSDMVRDAQEKVQRAEMQLNLLKSERKLSRDRANTDLKHFKKVKWGNLYEKSSPEVKKMIVNYLILRIDVFRGYSICMEVNSLIAII